MGSLNISHFQKGVNLLHVIYAAAPKHEAVSERGQVRREQTISAQPGF